MLDRIKAILRDQPVAADTGGFDQLQIAVAVLLIEAARMDNEFDADERAAIGQLLQRRFELAPGDAEKLLALAEEKADDSVEFYTFTRTVKDAFEHEDRVEFMQMLWEVAYADGELHDHEANLMRRVTGLMHVTDRESGEARKRALRQLGYEA
ncbi:MAG: TerB family tellurite resistance protein [Rhodovibrio sp.]|nr:TerB family tellurite resistance protein [Rhodovibrio sp.]